MLNLIKSRPVLSLLPILLMALCGFKYQNENVDQNKSNRPIRLIVNEQGIIWDDRPLSFEQPLKEWIAILGDNYYQGGKPDEPWELRALNRPQVFIYPELGIEIDLGFNYVPLSERNIVGKHGIGISHDPYNSYISHVSIQLNSLIKTNNINIKEHLKNHFYNTMYANYAIDYFGAIIDSNTPMAQIVQFGRNVRYGDGANTLGVFEHGGAAFSMLFYKPHYKTRPEMIDSLILVAQRQDQ